MIPRYTRKEMADVWSDAAKWGAMLRVELLVCEAWTRAGKIPKGAWEKIRKKAKADPETIAVIEEKTRHDVIAFVSAVAESVGEEGRYLHRGLTSSDVLDTGLGLQLVRASKILEEDLKKLIKVLEYLVKKYAKTPMIGRTHGIHAEPITFGLKVAGWLAEMRRQRERLKQAAETVAVGKISGAVGTYSQVPPELEAEVLGRLGLRAETAPTQVVSRDRHAFFFSVLAGIGGSIERIAVEIRHLARTEIGEVLEPFGRGQKGSSAMPHKRNPILSENLTGLARLLRGYAQAAFENVPLWHERDISHSGVERVMAPDATILLDFMLCRLTGLLKGMEVRPERMRANMEKTRGVIFSQEVLQALIEAGLSREKAYKIVQRQALRALENGTDFRACIESDPEAKKVLKSRDLREVFDWKRKLAGIEAILRRV